MYHTDNRKINVLKYFILLPLKLKLMVLPSRTNKNGYKGSICLMPIFMLTKNEKNSKIMIIGSRRNFSSFQLISRFFVNRNPINNPIKIFPIPLLDTALWKMISNNWSVS